MDPHAQNEGFTNVFLDNIYETLVTRGKDLKVEPLLATSWSLVNPTTTRFKLRPNVKFQEGEPFTADDVVFSIQRALEDTSNFKPYLAGVKEARKVDDLTVDIITDGPAPVLVPQLTEVRMMSRSWCVKHNVTKPQDFKNKEETFASRNTNGTGEYVLKSREADVKTVRHPEPELVGQARGQRGRDRLHAHQVRQHAPGRAPLGRDRLRARSPAAGHPAPEGEPGHQGPRGHGEPHHLPRHGPVPRRAALLEREGQEPVQGPARAPGLPDVAIDLNAIKTQVMRGLSVPTAVMYAPQVDGYPKELDVVKPPDRERAKKLMAEAGYPDGFEVTLDCPNNRYVNDEKICVAIAGMLAQINVKVRVATLPRAQYFPKIQNYDTSFYMLGWGVPTFDSQYALQSLVRTVIPKTADGDYNFGHYSNAKVDEDIDKLKTEIDPKKRAALALDASRIHQQEVGHLPLHFQVIPWAMRSNVSVVHRADNKLTIKWVKIQ